MYNISALIDYIYHLTRYSLIQTTACESICKSNLFIHTHPDVSALGESPIAKLQIHLFIKPWQKKKIEKKNVYILSFFLI